MSDGEAGGRPSAGALLRAARERQGLHIAALAAAIKVTPRKLDALENDRWSELPDATFTRALAQTVCRSLKIDPRPVLELLPPPETATLEPPGRALNERFGEGHAGERHWAGAAIRPMVLAALLLLLAALVVSLAPESWWGGGQGVEPAATPASAALAAPAAAPAVEPGLAASAAAGAPMAADGAAAASAPAAGATAGTTAAAPTAERSETVFSVPTPTAAASAPVLPAGVLQLRVSEASWIEVRDAGGRALLSRTVLPGEAVGLDGRAPLRLVVGNAPATEMLFRGRPVDLQPHTRDTVARLELQ